MFNRNMLNSPVSPFMPASAPIQAQIANQQAPMNANPGAAPSAAPNLGGGQTSQMLQNPQVQNMLRQRFQEMAAARQQQQAMANSPEAMQQRGMQANQQFNNQMQNQERANQQGMQQAMNMVQSAMGHGRGAEGLRQGGAPVTDISRQANPADMARIQEMRMNQMRNMQQAPPQDAQTARVTQQMRGPNIPQNANPFQAGGFRPTVAASGNPQLGQQMDQNRFMQMLQQRLYGGLA